MPTKFYARVISLCVCGCVVNDETRIGFMFCLQLTLHGQKKYEERLKISQNFPFRLQVDCRILNPNTTPQKRFPFLDLYIHISNCSRSTQVVPRRLIQQQTMAIYYLCGIHACILQNEFLASQTGAPTKKFRNVDSLLLSRSSQHQPSTNWTDYIIGGLYFHI